MDYEMDHKLGDASDDEEPLREAAWFDNPSMPSYLH